MEINKKDLKKESRAFRSIASRVMIAHYDEVDSILKKFIDHIDNSHLISAYILSIKDVDFDEASIMKNFFDNQGIELLNTGSNVEEEVVYTYKILKHMVEKKISVLSYPITKAYGYSTKFQDTVKGFGERVILPFVNHVESYLNEIAIDMGFDEETNYVITVHGGQVNIAKDQSTLNATQYNIDIDKLDGLVQKIKDLLTAEIDPEVKGTIDDNVDVIQEELKKEKPRKGFIKVAIEGLQNVHPKIEGSIKLASAITNIINFAMNAL